MLGRVNDLPFSLYSYLIDEFSVVEEKYSYRPDLLVKDQYGESFFIEVLCNEASNVSPITLVPGTEYKLPSYLFQKYFLEVGNGYSG